MSSENGLNHYFFPMLCQNGQVLNQSLHLHRALHLVSPQVSLSLLHHPAHHPDIWLLLVPPLVPPLALLMVLVLLAPHTAYYP